MDLFLGKGVLFESFRLEFFGENWQYLLTDFGHFTVNLVSVCIYLEIINSQEV